MQIVNSYPRKKGLMHNRKINLRIMELTIDSSAKSGKGEERRQFLKSFLGVFASLIGIIVKVITNKS